jgi:hypothetical protein
MASTINVELDGDSAAFTFKPVDRAALYGKRRRIALDESGQPCSRASLLDDGSMLLRSGMTAQGYFLPDGTWVPQGELEAVDANGSPAERVPSTLGEAQRLSLATPEELLDLHVQTVYALEPESITDSLAQALNAGALYSFAFNYRPDYRSETAILLANDDGYWALVGNPATAEWQELASVTAVTAASDDAGDDDLDFEMF